jgi:glycine/D-amino acid oxidase-like deaminating enzyme
MRTWKSPDVIVIGGGIVGAFTSYYLMEEGMNVLLVDRGDFASGTSAAGEGGVAIHNKTIGKDMDLARESLRLYDALSRELGREMELRKIGGMIVAETEEEAEALKKRVTSHMPLGIKVRWMDRKETLEEEPCLSGHIAGASICEVEGQINPMATTFAVIRRAKAKGLRVSPFSPVTGIDYGKGKTTAVQAGGRRISTRFVVNAAGAWAPEIGSMVGLKIPISPRRGILVVSEPLPPLVRHFLLEASYMTMKLSPQEMERSSEDRVRKGVGFVIEQTEPGTLVIGSSREFAGYTKKLDFSVLQHILRRAIRFVPMLRQVSGIRFYSGLRPYTPDNLPIVGEVPGIEGFIMAAGHEGSGITLAPVTGKLVSEVVAKKTTSLPIEKLGLSRFQETQERALSRA